MNKGIIALLASLLGITFFFLVLNAPESAKKTEVGSVACPGDSELETVLYKKAKPYEMVGMWRASVGGHAIEYANVGASQFNVTSGTVYNVVADEHGTWERLGWIRIQSPSNVGFVGWVKISTGCLYPVR